MSDLIERLQAEAANWSATCGDLFAEAATALEAAQRENERLREAVREACDIAIGAGADTRSALDRINELRQLSK